MKLTYLSMPVFLAAGLVIGSTAIASGTQTTAQAPQANADATRNVSNRPTVPERQSGKPYAAVIQDNFGDRERNFESGRR